MSTWLHKLFGHNSETEPDESLIPEEVFDAVVPIGDREEKDEFGEFPEPEEEEGSEDITIVDEAAQVDTDAVVEAAREMGSDFGLSGEVVGIAAEDSDREGHVRILTPPRIAMSIALPDYYRRAYHGSMCVSMIDGPRNFYAGQMQTIGPTEPRTPIPMGPGRFQYGDSKFSEKVQKRAWKLLNEYMKPSQYNAFMAGRAIELVNKTESHRLMINMAGHFTILEGILGDGFVVLQGAIKEKDYPLGDEMAAFMDWFRFKTGELIDRWNCGNFSIVPEGKKR